MYIPIACVGIVHVANIYSIYVVNNYTYMQGDRRGVTTSYMQ